ncbi:MAG: extracellular solute-binding protein, partial [Clostridia bacterium]|nr:extracellular solute-binding protein [Clostridia bacterium]
MNSWYSTVDLSNATLLNEISSRAGVKIDWNLIDPTVYADSVSPMLASGQDLPDIIQLPDLDTNMIYLSTGMFVPLDEHMDIMPNYAKFLEENPNIKAMLTAVDGHIYYVPQTVVTNNYQPVLMLNMPWLEKAGLAVPATLDDFAAMLRTYAEQDMNGNGEKDEVPMSMQSAFLPYAFGPAFGLDLVSGFYADDEGKVHYAAYEADAYKAYLKFLNGLYNEGLLETEFTSLNRDQITSRCANDGTGATFDYSWQMSTLYSAQYPNYDGTVGIIAGAAPLSGEHAGFYVGRNPVSSIFGINAKTANAELAIKFLDYAMSEEAQDLYVWGMEGLTYEVDADGNRHYLPRC